MFSLRTLLAAAPLLVLAIAQNVAFTSTPTDAVAGESYNITWGGGDGSPVTITLRRGNPQDLDTVETIANSVEENYFVWTVPDSLESGDDYALEITQGDSDPNYSGLFSVGGGSASSTTSSSSSSPASTTAASETATSETSAASATGFGNSTASVTSVESITSLASASGTSTTLLRNSTFSTASLTSASASNTHDFNDLSTSTSSSATRTPSSESTTAPTNDAPIRAGSSAALILGIVAAVMLH